MLSAGMDQPTAAGIGIYDNIWIHMYIYNILNGIIVIMSNEKPMMFPNAWMDQRPWTQAISNRRKHLPALTHLNIRAMSEQKYQPRAPHIKLASKHL